MPTVQASKSGSSSASRPPVALSAPAMPSINNPFSKTDRAPSVSIDASTSTPSASSSHTVSPTKSSASNTDCKSTVNSQTVKSLLDPLSFVPPSIFATA
ncbi:hypothetical protein HYDPIDRAFT_114309 [Hydnomerulius pinastri MD-312]|uniref:Uncharacterized protein n=1 Tax=Hydnomerulius pinastri MD-312 TaxID=994086 RepID=A0A0C9WD23_9AGAM|nr:hypothetical protein HYDPIDRAFT_114309 [Hydnomerulius pinastri MD-312]